MTVYQYRKKRSDKVYVKPPKPGIFTKLFSLCFSISMAAAMYDGSRHEKKPLPIVKQQATPKPVKRTTRSRKNRPKGNGLPRGQAISLLLN